MIIFWPCSISKQQDIEYSPLYLDIKAEALNVFGFLNIFIDPLWS